MAPFTVIALMTWGSYVRSIGAGLGCPDWPLCHGQLLPLGIETMPGEYVFAEFFHRILALIVAIVLFGLLGMALMNRTQDSRLLKITGLLAILLSLQILMGGLLIFTRLNNTLVNTSHLTLATTIFGLTIIHAMWFRESSIQRTK